MRKKKHEETTLKLAQNCKENNDYLVPPSQQTL